MSDPSDHPVLPELPGFHCRPVVPADAAAVIAIINAAEVLDVGEPLLEQSDVETDWASSKIDLTLDTVVVLEGDDPVAFGQVAAERADVFVHPSFRGRGIGTALLEWSEKRARLQAAPGAEARVGQTVPTGSEAAGLLERNGYQPLWDSWVLHLQPEAVIEQRTIEGIEIRPYVADEEQAIHEVIERAFNEWPDRHPQSFALWQESVIGRAGFDPSLLLVAVEGPTVIGAAVGINYDAEGWVDQVAVVPSHRNRGIASALLAALQQVFRSQGQTRFGLNTDSRTGALDLYLRLGMEVEHSFTRWSRPLDRP